VTSTLVASLIGTGKVYATALLNDQLFVTHNGGAAVSVYDTSLGSLQLTRTITFYGLGETVRGLATSAIYNYLYVGDYTNQLVHRVDLSVTSEVSVVTWGLFSRWPFALSMTSENNVLVTIFPDTIEEYTPSGSLVRSIITTSTPYQAVQVNNSVWAFTDYDANQICTVLTTGTVIKCFGSTAGPGLALAMNQPHGMVIDIRGYMLVADRYNDIILLINPTLTSARQLQLPVIPAMTSPCPISYDQSMGRLYVGETDGQYRVLVFDGIWW